MIRKIQGGWFDDDLHEYLDEQKRFVPSCTQIMSLARYSNFDGIPSAVVRNAAIRGDGAHWLTQVYDEEGEFPPPDVPADQLIRFEGYRAWRERENFVPEKIEYPVISSVYGMAFGATLDRIGMMRGAKAIVELKFTYAPPKTAGIQLAAQEIALTSSPQIGQYVRVMCHVDKNGNAKTIIHRDPQDAQRFIFALGVVYTRLDMGQDIRKEVIEEE